MGLANVRKAIAAGVSAAVAFALPVVQDGVSPEDVSGTVGAFVLAALLTFWVKNKPLSDILAQREAQNRKDIY